MWTVGGKKIEPAKGFSFVKNPDLGKISELICSEWARPCWNYDSDLLRAHLMRPSGDLNLSIGQVLDKSGKLASYLAYMPFEVEYYGEKLSAVFGSFLTTAKKNFFHGVSAPQQGHMIETAIEQGYDAFICICEVGAASNRSILHSFKSYGIELKLINVFQYMMGLSEIINPALPDAASGHTRLYTAEDFDSVKPLVQSLGGSVPMKKTIPEQDINFLFGSRPYTRTYLYDTDNSIRALANILLLEVLDEEIQRNVYFDNVNFGDLTETEAASFVTDIMIDLQKDDIHAAFMPDIGYVDKKAFRKNRFRLAPRQLNIYMGALNETVLARGVREVDSFYIDVF